MIQCDRTRSYVLLKVTTSGLWSPQPRLVDIQGVLAQPMLPPPALSCPPLPGSVPELCTHGAFCPCKSFICSRAGHPPHSPGVCAYPFPRASSPGKKDTLLLPPPLFLELLLYGRWTCWNDPLCFSYFPPPGFFTLPSGTCP